MYLGYAAETEASRRAVEETRSQVMRDRHSNYIDAYYSSSAGLYSSSPVDVWGLSHRPYLLAVEDYPETSNYKSWTREFSQEELNVKLQDLRLGQIHSITVFQRSAEGRATKIQVCASELREDSKHSVTERRTVVDQAHKADRPDNHCKYLTAEELRHKLALPSTYFELSSDSQVQTSKSKYIFKGQGFGHGIGMSQHGARKLAEKGWTYKQILEHYYNATGGMLLGVW